MMSCGFSREIVLATGGDDISLSHPGNARGVARIAEALPVEGRRSNLLQILFGSRVVMRSV